MSQNRPDAAGPWAWSAAILDLVTGLCFRLSALFLFLLLLAYVYEVAVRYFFNSPTSWTYDYSTWFLALATMLALPEITRRHQNITIGFLVEKLPRGARGKAERIIALAAFIFCLLTAWICFQETARQFTQGIETYWNNPAPKWWVSSVLPLSFVLTSLQFLRSALKRGPAWA